MATQLTEKERSRPAGKAADALGRRNRQLAAALGCVAAAIFVTVVCLAMMFHYAEAHHLIAEF